MKKLIPVMLAIIFLLTGCRGEESPAPSATGPPVTEQTDHPEAETTVLTLPPPTGEITECTDPTNAPVAFPTTVPESTEPVVLPPRSEPQVTVPHVIPTEPAPTETQPPTTDPLPTQPESTEPPTTVPPETQPAEPSPTEPTPTEPPKESVDAAAIESAAEGYAQSLGFIIDGSLGKGSGGYYPPEYAPLSTTSEGKSIAKGLVNATKNQLNSRFSEEYCDVLVEGAYGLARMNCTVVYSHTDELGEWYTIYVFYG